MAIRNLTGNQYVSKPNRESATSGFLNLTGGPNEEADLLARKNQKTQAVQPVSTGSGSSSSSSSSSGTTYYAPTTNNYASALAQMQAQQQAQARAAYESGMNRLNQAWNAKTGALKDNLSATLSNLGRQYNSSKNEVTNDANKSLREAYINHMLNRKNINQNLTARGVGGGAAESTMANMYNTYGNSRNDINTTLNDNLTDLENMYQANVSNAQQQYNSAYADAMSQYMNSQAQMEQNLANSIIGSYGDMIASLGKMDNSYVNTLNQLLANQQGYEYAPTVNTLGVDLANTTQETNRGTVTDYAKYISAQRASGASDEEIARNLRQQGLDLNTVAQLFSI